MHQINKVQNIELIARQRNLFIVLCLISFIITLVVSLKLFTRKERVILIPGLSQEVWVEDKGVSSSYLEESTNMYLPLLLDLDVDSIDWKRNRILAHVSKSDVNYIKSLSAYYARVKEQYKQFSLSTHFALKKLEINSKKLVVIAKGQLISRFGSGGFESEPADYRISFEWLSGKLLLKEFVQIRKGSIVK
ncbi:MAG: hypothetical protein DGJ47_000892 [Rickettsiaceae bacterium]